MNTADNAPNTKGSNELKRSAQDIAEDLIGTWRLISYESLHDTGELVIPHSDKPKGSLIYTPSGDFAIHFHHPERPAFASADPVNATAEECHLNFFFYISYYGKYTFLDNEMAVLHHVNGSSFPNWDGDDLKRFIELKDNRLKLVSPEFVVRGDKVVGTLEWERED